MKIINNLLLLGFWCSIVFLMPHAAAQSGCMTASEIESMNKNMIEKRFADIKGAGAVIYIALDPMWSLPEFTNVPYRHPDDMAVINKKFEQLVKEKVDEVIVWKFGKMPGLGAAVPFRNGCAVEVYGEPDESEKLELMYQTYLLVSKYGLDSPQVRQGIRRLIDLRYSSYADEGMVDVVINKLRPLLPGNIPDDKNAIKEDGGIKK